MYVTSSYNFKIVNPSVSLLEGEKLYFRLFLSSSSSSNFTASLGQGKLSISSLASTLGYSAATCPHFLYTSMSAETNANEIIFSQGLSTFYDNDYIFVPNPNFTGSSSFPSSSLYNSTYGNYGDVSYPWVAKPQDIILFQLSDKTYFESRINDIYFDDQGYLRFVLNQELPQQLKDDISSSNGSGLFRKFIVLTGVEDETNLYVNFNKLPGSTSYGFILPESLAPDILKNIDTITSQVKQKLLADQQGTISL
jgi:hypothetical protein